MDNKESILTLKKIKIYIISRRSNLLENNINYILWPHLLAWTFRWVGSLTWYQSLVDPGITSSNLTTLILFDKNEAQRDVGLCKFQAQRAFTWECVLENNINHILGRWDDSLTLRSLIVNLWSGNMDWLSLSNVLEKLN